MIVVTLQTPSYRIHQTWNHFPFTLGKGASGITHFSLDNKEFEKEHIRISFENNAFRLHNLAHDPSVTLNSLAFGSRTLREGDTLHIGNTSLRIDTLLVPSPEPEEVPTPLPAPTSEEVEQLLEKVEQIVPRPEHHIEQLPSNPPSPKNIPIRWIRGLCFSILSVFLLIFCMGSALYLTDTSREDQEEAVIAAADTAMALLHSQLFEPNHLHRDWHHLPLLSTHLREVAGQTLSPIRYLNNDSNQLNSSYNLHILIDPVDGQFLVVLHPYSPVRQMISALPSLIVDSTNMTIRSVSDNASIEQLLTLQDLKAASSFLAQQPTVLLKDYANNLDKKDLYPPKGLGFISPEAEEKIYNTPRYYRLTERFLQLAVLHEDDEEITSLQELIHPLSHLSHLVFYTTEGTEAALHAYEMLHRTLPQEEYLVGTLTLNPLTDAITNGTLLTLKGNPFPKPAQKEIASADLDEKPIFEQTPWSEQMAQLRHERTKMLTPLANALEELLHKHTDNALPDFEAKWQYLSDKYLQVSRDEEIAISEELHSLYRDFEYNALSPQPIHFYQSIQQAKLTAYLDEELKEEIESEQEGALTLQSIEGQVKHLDTIDDPTARLHSLDTLLESIEELPSPLKEEAEYILHNN